MSLFADKSVQIEKLDDGWLLTWEDRSLEETPAWYAGAGTSKPKVRGKEVVTSQKKLIERVKALTS